MKNVMIVLMVVMTTIVCGQSITELDKKNGFKDFKIGDPYSKWKTQIAFQYSEGKESKTYTYFGDCCNKLFDSPVDIAFLTFFNDTLRYIGIFLKSYEDGRKTNTPIEFKFPFIKYDKLLTDFKSLFGIPKEALPDEKSGLYASNVWEGKKIVLIVDYYYLGNYDYSKVVVLDKAYYTKQKSSGF